MISGEQIEQKPSVKYLGVHIDNKLKWKDHIKAVASKVARAIAMIRHAKKFLPKHTLKVLYQGLVEPHLRFCCSVWGTCGVTTRCTLEKLQNRAIRIITDSPFDAPAKPLLRQLRLPINGQAPVYLSSLFNSTSAVTNRMLRNSNLNLRPPRMKTTFGQNGFAYRGATIWNSLPNDCRTAHTFRTFKMKLKAMLAYHHLFFHVRCKYNFCDIFPFFCCNNHCILAVYIYIVFLFKGGPLENQQC